jgi:hypothetical protein
MDSPYYFSSLLAPPFKLLWAPIFVGDYKGLDALSRDSGEA